MLLAACATPQADALRADRPAALPGSADLAYVPFIPQAEYQCGPASLAMVLRTTGSTVATDELTQQVFVPARAGSLQPEMLATARRHARLAVVLPPRLESLLAEVAAGTPVIVLQNLALPVAPVWHYAVAVGYDLEAGQIVLHSGVTPRQRMPIAVFERTWARGGHWAMVATPPAHLPATPPAERLAEAAAALERVDAAAARQAFDALTRRAPTLYAAWIGLGNTAYAGRDFSAAAAAFERATHLRPDAGDAWNNLALAWLGAGQRADARRAAQRAVELAGPRADRYRATLEAIGRM